MGIRVIDRSQSSLEGSLVLTQDSAITSSDVFLLKRILEKF